MSSKQSEFKKGKKRSLDINEKESTEPQLKRRKIAAKFSHLNFDPTKLKPGHTVPTKVTKKSLSTAKEMDQTAILNKPIILNKGRKKRTKKRIQIPITKQSMNEIIEIPKNIKHLVLNSEHLFDENEEIKCIRCLENERIKIYSSNNEMFKKGTYKLSVEFNKQESEEIFEKVIVINDKNEIFELECEDKITMESVSISECIEYTFNDCEWFIGEITNDSLEYYKQSKFLDWKNQIIKPVCEAAFKRLLCIGLITNIFDRFVFKSPENEQNNFIIKDSNGRDVNIPRPVKKLRKWNVKNRKYESIDPHLNGAPQQNEAHEYWQQMIKEFKEKYGNEYINNLLSSFKTQ